MKEILLVILNGLIPTIVTLLAGVLTWLGLKINKYLTEKERNEIIKSIIENTVKYVEQVYKDIHGPEKLEQAKEIAFMWLNEKGIEIGDAELTILIESFVNAISNK